MIGVFDSGYGGLTILKSLLQKLPEYDYIFLGDNARAPYGARSYEVICQFTLQGVKRLFDLGCPVVVVACNTASARALRTLQQRYLPTLFPDRRLLGMIRPSAEALAHIPVGDVENRPRLEIAGKVAVLGTRETIGSRSFLLELEKLAPNLRVYQQACPIWVPLVESGELDSAGTEWFIKRDLDRIFAENGRVDRVLLACTHYPALLRLIQKHTPTTVEILTQAPIIAERFADWLKRHPEFETRLSKTSALRFLTTDDRLYFDEVANSILGISVKSETIRIDEDSPVEMNSESSGAIPPAADLERSTTR
jgi:glutamate racemase